VQWGGNAWERRSHTFITVVWVAIVLGGSCCPRTVRGSCPGGSCLGGCCSQQGSCCV